MIATGEPQEFTPFGSEYLAHHPGSVRLRSAPKKGEPNSYNNAELLEALRGVSLQVNRKSRRDDFWKLRESPGQGSDGEEELYVSGDTAVWSESSGTGVRTAIRSFCVESKIQDALWCSFLADDYKARLLARPELRPATTEQRVPCVCVLDAASGAIHSFSRSGEDYTTPVPFVVSRAWPIKQGLLLERSVPGGGSKTSSSALSVLFSLLHPLDEVTPVVTRITVHGHIPTLAYLQSAANVRVVLTCDEPSVALLYHGDQGTHSVWEVRRTTAEEDQFACSVKQCGGSTFAHSPLRTPTPASPASPVVTHSTPVSGHWATTASRPASPRSQSPSLGHMATLSRSQSPSLAFCVEQGSYSTVASPATLTATMTQSELQVPSQPLLPDVCLDQLWLEPQPSEEKASKAFWANNMVGQSFLCYQLPSLKLLKLVPYSRNGPAGRLVFGKAATIAALDAEPLTSLGMLLTLDLNGGLSLYAGTNKVCKVHVSSPPFPLKHELDGGSVPRRSSLNPLHVSLDASLPDISVSPVRGFLHCPEESFPTSARITLRDAVRNRVTLEYPSGEYRRLCLPAMSRSRLVEGSLGALCKVLPKELAVCLLAKWYMSRNAPGPTDLTASSELHSFLIFVLGMVGHPTGGVACRSGNSDAYHPMAVKKSKSSEMGSDDDWRYLLDRGGGSVRRAAMGLPKPGPHMLKSSGTATSCDGNAAAPLFQYVYPVLHALHLVYEDAKLNVLNWPLVPQLAEFLFKLSAQLSLRTYQDLYRRDFPAQIGTLPVTVPAHSMQGPTVPAQFPQCPPSIFAWIQERLRHSGGIHSRFPYIPDVTTCLRAVVPLYAVLTSPPNEELLVSQVLHDIVETKTSGDPGLSVPTAASVAERLVCLLVQLGVTPQHLARWPSGVVAPIQDAMVQCQDHPPPEWSAAAYSLIGREDLATLCCPKASKDKVFLAAPVPQEGCKQGSSCKEKDNGFGQLDQEMLKLRFSKDQRVLQVCKMLQSSCPVSITIQQRPEVSDHEFMEDQERHLYGLSIRTMALPVGRGMLTLHTCRPVLTDPLPIPKLCLTGRVPPQNTTVDMSHIEVPPNMNVWPLFHNGVAAGLRICPGADEVDSSWIVYNRPRGTAATDATLEHAGFLLGLGLNGHLSKLSTTALHDYLLKNHELTSVGLLLGLAASKRGTMNLACTKLMSIHVDALLPPTSTELDVHPLVRVASVMGLGLLYAESGHRHMAETLLGEIGRPPGPEMDHCVDRESYALAAGLALGLVMLGKGGSAVGLPDLHMADQLYHFMVGGHVRAAGSASQRERFRSPSYQIREGNAVNVDVTSPAATLALGLMFFNSGKVAVAKWMSAPDTQYLLDMVRPDFLLLRTLGAGLVLWSDVRPTRDWVESHVPDVVSTHAFGNGGPESSDVDQETMSQAYCNILAGACLCLGLKFAGSANGQAFDTLLHYTRLFLDLQRRPSAEQAGRNTLETCLLASVLGLSLVMAGTGDLEVLRLCRHLRLRSGQASGHVLYGSHLATHMAMGLLFLGGGGGLTLGTSPLAVAALVCALFPRFPIHSSDNRYHLQAFRHLYVLAVEPRLLLPADIASKKAVYTHLELSFGGTQAYPPCKYAVSAPCQLPELPLLNRVALNDPRYWPVAFERGKNWERLQGLLASPRATLHVKQKAGCLPYAVDPRGYKTAFEQSAIKELLRGWSERTKVSACFSDNTVIAKFTECFLQLRASGNSELGQQRSFCKILMECTLREKADALSTLFDLFQSGRHDFSTSTLPLWQTKLVTAYHAHRSEQYERSLVHTDFVLSLQDGILQAVRDALPEDAQRVEVRNYLRGDWVPAEVFPFLVLHDVPSANTVLLGCGGSGDSFPSLWLQSTGASLDTRTVLASIL
ncbi:unnamed protein product [Ixodes hexagonus]